MVVCLFDVFVRSMLLSSNPSRRRRRPCLICFPIPRVKVYIICMTEDKFEKLTYLQYVMYILPTFLSASCFDLLRRTNTCAKHTHTHKTVTPTAVGYLSSLIFLVTSVVNAPACQNIYLKTQHRNEQKGPYS